MHENYMRRCFELARQGMGSVSPNPMVGAVIVKNGKIIAEGFHEKHGGPHAEANAFLNALEDVVGATLYVNLEPCCHTKKLTPPCAPQIIEKKISHVVVSNVDPNPQVAGLGLDLLRASGIQVTTGVLESEGAELNEIFFHRMKTGRPFVHLKAAATLDGKIALSSGESKWITGPEARSDSHWGRHSCDAIAVGAETLRKDDPALTVRIREKAIPKQPYRLIFTKSGDLPPQSQVFTDEFRHRTLIVTGEATVISVLPPQQVIRLKNLAPLDFDELFTKLFAAGIYSLWLEGGSKLQSQFLAARLVDRMTLYLAPKIMGQGVPLFTHTSSSLAGLPTLSQPTLQMLGEDLKITGRL